MNLVRFAFSYNWMYGPALKGSWSKIKKYSTEHWFKRLISSSTYDDTIKASTIGHEASQEIVSSMQEYSQDILTWISDMNYSTTVDTDQKMKLIYADFFSEYTPKNNSNKISLKEKLTAGDKKEFKNLFHENENISLAKIMSNISYLNINKDQKGLGVFMDTLFRSCR